MIRPILKESQGLVETNPGKFPVFEIVLRDYMLFFQEGEENLPNRMLYEEDS